MSGNVKWTTFSAKEFVEGISREDIKNRIKQEELSRINESNKSNKGEK